MHPELTSADTAASQFLHNYVHPVLAGVVFSGLFAAIMSTSDSFLNIGTAAIMHDIPKAVGIKIKNELYWARITTFLLTLLAGAFALYSGDLIAISGAFGWGTFAAAIVPTVICFYGGADIKWSYPITKVTVSPIPHVINIISFRVRCYS